MRFCKNRVPKIECFRGLDFEGLGGGFGQGLGRPKTSIFALFSMIFRSKFWKTFWKGKKTKKRASAGGPPEKAPPQKRNVRARGREREGDKFDQDLDEDLDLESSTRRHLRWGGGF